MSLLFKFKNTKEYLIYEYTIFYRLIYITLIVFLIMSFKYYGTTTMIWFVIPLFVLFLFLLAPGFHARFKGHKIGSMYTGAKKIREGSIFNFRKPLIVKIQKVSPNKYR